MSSRTVCAEYLRKKILTERKNAKYYSIIVDAAPDSAHEDQTVFVLRYVHFNLEINEYIIFERLLEFVNCIYKTGEAIAELIRSTLSIPLKDCRGQCYDNGSNMKGQYKGAPARLLSDTPLALYSPVASLNLCGIQAAENFPEIQTFFGVLQRLYNVCQSPKMGSIKRKHRFFTT